MAEDEKLLQSFYTHSKSIMSSPKFDCSHDFAHVLRVTNLAKHILGIEKKDRPGQIYNSLILEIACLLHDAEDHKYLSDNCDLATSAVWENLALREDGQTIKTAVLQIIPRVSYSYSQKFPEEVRRYALKHPELKILQDADKLDALGAIGVARAFSFGATRGRTMQNTLQHFDDKLEQLPQHMWTDEGKRLATVRLRRLQTFRSWFEEEDSDANISLMIRSS